MKTYTHDQFMDAFTTEMRSSYAANNNQETIILGAVQLFWNHSKNIYYLNQAMQYARGRRGVRVNAVKSFLIAHTGAVFKGNEFKSAGRKMKECPESFASLNSWVDWANEKAPEPEYKSEEERASMVKILSSHMKKARDNNDTATADLYADMLGRMNAAMG